MGVLYFFIGCIVGCLVGVVFMCLLQINRDENES